jgi:hypothetical protein
MSAGQRLSSEAGYSLVEMLIASAIMITVTGAIFGLLNPAQGTAQAQPEQSDLQQRMRIGSDVLFKEMLMAGAGPYFGSRTGSLINFFAPIVPRRMGLNDADARDVALADIVTLSYIPNSYSQTTIEQSMPPQSTELKVTYPPNCPVAKDLCGFEIGMSVIIFDSTGHFDTFTLTQVQHDAGHLQHRGQTMNHEYAAGSTITQVVTNTYYRNPDTNQLVRYDGGTSELPLVDDVVDLRFEYFGDPNPPTQPKPSPGAGANCLYDEAGNYNAGAMPVLASDEGSLAKLPLTMFQNGPWCGGGDNEFDADLLRIRKVRVTLRMQAASPTLRGTDANLFMNPGKSQGGNRLVPDYTVRFEITPRNLNLTR